MLNHRKYGQPPYRLVLLHGGPGANGQMVPVAEELSGGCGVMEALQTKSSVKGQLLELHEIITEAASLPVKIIGHSWGAWLALMYAAEFPSEVDKLIIVGTGPFEEQYLSEMTQTRLDRMSDVEKDEFERLQIGMRDPRIEKLQTTFENFGKLMTKTDSFDLLPEENDKLCLQPAIFKSIWGEVGKMRSSGELLRLVSGVKCPVVAIHGDYDPHPSEAVINALWGKIEQFKMIVLPACGHYPWRESSAKNEFYELLKQGLEGGSYEK